MVDSFRIQGARVVLRDHAPGDAPGVLQYSSDAEVARYVPWEAGALVDAETFVARTLAAAARRPRTD